MLINELPLVMIECLTLTIVIELLFAFILRVKDMKDYLNILLVNVITNPLVVSISVFINIKFGLLERNIVLIGLEILVVFVEGLIYKKYMNYRKIEPFILSVILNCFSYFLGELVNYIL